jgi:ubiquinone biosynthesis protein COQ9
MDHETAKERLLDAAVAHVPFDGWSEMTLRAMLAALAGEDLSALRFRDRIARAVRLRIEAADIELVRRGTTLFSLPQNAAQGAGAIWGTADAIWTALGDTKRDLNWYTKRATLSGVYGATVLFWLGDDSPDQRATWEFLDRRIANVMEIEKLKATINDNPLAKAVFSGPAKVLESLSEAKGRWRDMGRKVP